MDDFNYAKQNFKHNYMYSMHGLANCGNHFYKQHMHADLAIGNLEKNCQTVTILCTHYMVYSVNILLVSGNVNINELKANWLKKG